KFIPVFRLAEQRKTKIQAARFERGPTQRILNGRGSVQVSIYDGAVARGNDCDCDITLPTHMNYLWANDGGQPFPIGTVLRRVLGIESFRVEILHICVAVGEAPGNSVVMSNYHEWSAGQSVAGHVPPWRR